MWELAFVGHSTMESDVALSPSLHPRSLYDANALSRVFRGRTFGWPLI